MIDLFPILAFLSTCAVLFGLIGVVVVMAIQAVDVEE